MKELLSRSVAVRVVVINHQDWVTPPLSPCDCNAEPVEDTETGGESQEKVTRARFLKGCMCIRSKHVAHCQGESGNPALQLCACAALDNPAAPLTTLMQQQPSFPNYALLEGNIIPGQGQGGAV